MLFLKKLSFISLLAFAQYANAQNDVSFEATNRSIEEDAPCVKYWNGFSASQSCGTKYDARYWKYEMNKDGSCNYKTECLNYDEYGKHFVETSIERVHPNDHLSNCHGYLTFGDCD